MPKTKNHTVVVPLSFRAFLDMQEKIHKKLLGKEAGARKKQTADETYFE
ncbi:MAG: hypothetical protein AAB604_00685 [Patescibacteria group bacterium]